MWHHLFVCFLSNVSRRLKSILMMQQHLRGMKRERERGLVTLLPVFNPELMDCFFWYYEKTNMKLTGVKESHFGGKIGFLAWRNCPNLCNRCYRWLAYLKVFIKRDKKYIYNRGSRSKPRSKSLFPSRTTQTLLKGFIENQAVNHGEQSHQHRGRAELLASLLLGEIKIDRILKLY